MSSSSVSPLARKGGAQRPRKESIGLLSTCSSHSFRPTRPSSSKGKSKKDGEVSNAVDDQVYWDPPLQSQVVRSIDQLRITSPLSCTSPSPPPSSQAAHRLDEGHPTLPPLSGIIQRAMPSQSHLESSLLSGGHRAKELRKRKRAHQDDQPSHEKPPRSHSTNPPGPSTKVLLHALKVKIESKKLFQSFKPPTAHRSHKSKRTSGSHRSLPRSSSGSSSIPKKTSSSPPTHPVPSTASSSKPTTTKTS